MASGAHAAKRGGHHPPGTALTRFKHPAAALAIEVQADGRVVAGGEAGHDWALVRYLRGGKLDRRFHRTTSSPGAEALIADLAIQPDGKIIAVGDTAPRVRGARFDFLIARFLPNGRLDRSFGRGGYVRTDFGASDSATAVAVQPDGRIVVAGNSASRHGQVDFAVTRYGPDGSLDTAFGTQGKELVDFGGHSLVQAIRLMADGGIEIAGESGTGTADNIALARFASSGAPDPAFGANGRLLVSSLPPTAGPGEASFSQPSMAFTTDGDLVAVAEGGAGINSARFRSDGTLDPSYGSGGLASVVAAGAGFVTGVAVGANGSIIVLETGIQAHKRSGPALTRLTSAGALDQSFGRGGHARSMFGGADDLSGALAVSQTGELFVGGVYSNQLIVKSGIFAVTSFDANGRLRRSFG